MQSRFTPRFLAFAVGCLCFSLLSSCSSKEKRILNVPAGFATNTLKEFARQAEVEIIFDVQSVYGVRTNALNGDYDAQSALRIMLADTPLKIDYDNETGAYAIIRAELSSRLVRIKNYGTHS